jgi:hypothetical protein
LHRNQRGQAGGSGHQDPFADFHIFDFVMPQNQKRFARGKRHVLARFEGQALLFERVGADGLVEIRIGLRGKCEQDDCSVVLGVLIAEEILAHYHARGRGKPDARAGRIGSVGRGRRHGAHGEREHDKHDPRNHGACHNTALEWRKYGLGAPPFA